MKFSIEISFVYSTPNSLVFRFIITLHIRKATELQPRSTKETKMVKAIRLVTDHCFHFTASTLNTMNQHKELKGNYTES